MQEIFSPNSIAVIGASNDEKKWGGKIVKNIISGGYTGAIYPINPREKIIQGLTSYPSVLEVPGKIDLSIIVVPAPAVLAVVDECGRKNIKGLVVISAGFAETGNKILEEELHAKVKQYGIKMCGPNCLGIANNSIGLNASILQELPKKGNISFIAQSGTMALAITEWAKEKNIGLNIIISTGNKTALDDVDYLEYLDADPNTKVIGIYAESIKRGRRFLKVAKRIKKPIVILKVGRSKKGAAAAFSHTSSLAGADEIFSAAFKQAGVIRVDTLDELFDAIQVLSMQPLPKGNTVGVCSNGGGAGIIAVDECAKLGIDVPDLTIEMVEKIKLVMPGFASAANPIDTAAVSKYETYRTIVGAFIDDPKIDSIVSVFIQDSTSNPQPSAQAIISLVTDKPIVACSMGGEKKREWNKILEEAGIPIYSSPDRAVRALGFLIQHKRFLDSVKL